MNIGQDGAGLISGCSDGCVTMMKLKDGLRFLILNARVSTNCPLLLVTSDKHRKGLDCLFAAYCEGCLESQSPISFMVSSF